MDADNLPKHSPMGASGAERFIACPGSVGLSQDHGNDEDDTFSFPGTCAHLLASMCLKDNDEPWTYLGGAITVGESFLSAEFIAKYGEPKDQHHIVTKEMADAVQSYLDDIKVNHPDRNQGNTWIERRFHCPTIHKYFFGTSDFIHLDPDGTLHVWDFKYGAGILVEPEDNAQLMYYACGAMEDLGLWPNAETVDDVRDKRKVVLHIHQPRILWHKEGPHRIWETTAFELETWLVTELIPAMDKAMVSGETVIGEHCRWCPAVGHKCPSIMQAEKELEKMVEDFATKPAAKRTPAEASRFRELFAVAKLVNKENDKNIFGFLSAGKDVPGCKLTKAKSDREWKDGADAAITKKFGKLAFTEPELKSPAQIDKLPGGEILTATYAFKPDRGMTVADAKDHRSAIKPQTGKGLFKPIAKAGK